MKKVSLFVMMLTLVSVTAVGQSFMLDFPNMNSETSVVRHCPNFSNCVILYSYASGDTTNHFSFVDLNNNVARSAPFVQGAVVNDVELVGDLAFFCGTMNGKALFGYFDISPLVLGSGTVDYLYTEIDTLDIENPSGSNITTAYYKNALKIAVYNVGNNFHAFLVADLTTSNSSTVYRAVFDICTFMGSNPTMWKHASLNDLSGEERFSDVVTTDNCIAFVSEHINTGEVSLHTMKKSIYGDLMFLSTPSGSDSSFFRYTAFPGTISEPIIAANSDTRVAIAFYGRSNAGYSSDIITADISVLFNNPVPIINAQYHYVQVYGTNNNSSKEMYEIHFSSLNDYFSLLHYAPESNFSNQSRFDEYTDNFLAPPINTFYKVGDHFCSLDNLPNNRWAISGKAANINGTGTQLLFVHDMGSMTCISSQGKAASLLTPTAVNALRLDYYFGCNFITLQRRTASSFPITVKRVCN